MGCGASKVSNQTLSPVESEVQNEATPKAINNVLSSSLQTTSTTSLIKTQNSITNNDSKNESATLNENKDTSTSSYNTKEQEVHLPLKKSSSVTLGLDKPKSTSIFKSKSKSSLIESTNKNSDNQKISDESQYLKKKDISSSNIISNKYGSK